MARKKHTLFGKPIGKVIKHPGSETRRAEENGRTVHEQAEIDKHSPDKRIRGKGTMALGFEKMAKRRHAGKHPITKAEHRKMIVRKRSTRKRSARKRG